MDSFSIFILACFVASCHALVGTTCLAEAECDAGECCQILSQFMVVSKRDSQLLAPAVYPTASKTGTCQLYKTEGQHCSSFEKINGYCSCGPGLTCHTYQRPLSTLTPTAVMTHMLSGRSMVAPQPGYEWVSKCEKI